jgi:hypothetical protein
MATLAGTKRGAPDDAAAEGKRSVAVGPLPYKGRLCGLWV